MTNPRARIKFELFCAIFLKPFKASQKGMSTLICSLGGVKTLVSRYIEGHSFLIIRGTPGLSGF